MKLESRLKESSLGFTLIEMLVALSLTSIAMGIVISSMLEMRSTYLADIKRVEMNGNLRSAMDIISMNIRQAGENLLAAFPAVILTSGSSGGSDTLTLRRSPITEVLTLCASVTGGADQLFVSSADLSNAECVPANVAPVYTVFTEQLAEADDSVRLFIYDKVLKTGEFVDYEGSGTESGQYYLTVSGVNSDYSLINTAIYLIEEYQFARGVSTNRLELTVNQDSNPRPVAFAVSDFQVTFTMEDGSTLSAFNQQSGSLDWKDIHQIALNLSGTTSYNGQSMTSTISSQYFPRNVLSYEGS